MTRVVLRIASLLLLAATAHAQTTTIELLDAGYHVATRRTVNVLLTSCETITGKVVVFRPPGHDRLSDYALSNEQFRYLELDDRTLLINSAHIVALTEVTS